MASNNTPDEHDLQNDVELKDHNFDCMVKEATSTDDVKNVLDYFKKLQQTGFLQGLKFFREGRTDLFYNEHVLGKEHSLGKTRNASVELVCDKETNQVMALKVMMFKDMKAEEILSLYKMRGKQVTPDIYHFEMNRNLLLITMQYIKGKTIKVVVEKTKSLGPDERLKLACFIISGVLTAFECLKSNDILHGDLHAENVMIEADSFGIFLIDLGQAVLMSNSKNIREEIENDLLGAASMFIGMYTTKLPESLSDTKATLKRNLDSEALSTKDLPGDVRELLTLFYDAIYTKDGDTSNLKKAMEKCTDIEYCKKNFSKLLFDDLVEVPISDVKKFNSNLRFKTGRRRLSDSGESDSNWGEIKNVYSLANGNLYFNRLVEQFNSAKETRGLLFATQKLSENSVHVRPEDLYVSGDQCLSLDYPVVANQCRYKVVQVAKFNGDEVGFLFDYQNNPDLEKCQMRAKVPKLIQLVRCSDLIVITTQHLNGIKLLEVKEAIAKDGNNIYGLFACVLLFDLLCLHQTFVRKGYLYTTIKHDAIVFEQRSTSFCINDFGPVRKIICNQETAKIFKDAIYNIIKFCLGTEFQVDEEKDNFLKTLRALKMPRQFIKCVINLYDSVEYDSLQTSIENIQDSLFDDTLKEQEAREKLCNFLNEENQTYDDVDVANPDCGQPFEETLSVKLKKHLNIPPQSGSA
ncbi:uncharacterized protein LOC131942366 isoform X1 [Physella acuta]|uniref:uncharacterized protein LOC131942366 isoform X1 n=1 Tax=Physella acuta TaxID=109671 RepID=UPI0027DE8AB3|nr:uncharacterized protein LOC131942366 isoform X1 [Physella acuta]